MTFDPDNFDIWREPEDLPRLELVGRALTADVTQLEVFFGEPPEEGYRYVYFRAPEVCPEPLFACVVGPEQDLEAAMARWVTQIFPGLAVPRFDVVFRT